MPNFVFRFSNSYCNGNWSLGGKYSYIQFKDFKHLITDTQVIMHKDIAWVGKHHFPNYAGRKCRCCNGVRYINADISYPGVLVKGGPNPYGNPYILIDGRHRLMKKLFQGMDESEHYVLYWEDIKEYLIWKEKD